MEVAEAWSSIKIQTVKNIHTKISELIYCAKGI